jgi:hypothetical protein
MSTRRRTKAGKCIVGLVLLAGLGPLAAGAGAAAPQISSVFASAVGADAARLSAQIDPKDSFTTYHFEYISEVAYQKNGGGFSGALRVPPKSEASVGTSPLVVSQQIFGLSANTTYRYRVVAQNSDPASPVIGPTKTIATKGPGPLLPDGRGWEMVSPIDKNGGQVDPPGTIAAGGTLQAAAAGGSITYSSAASFAGGQGAPPASQYLATRTASSWSTQNLTVPIFSGSYDTVEGGAPYRLFSADLARGLLLNGKSCRAEQTSGCPVANPTLAGTDAPAGYQDYYLRESSSGAFEALLGAADIAGLGLDPADFELRLEGASADLRHVVLSTCARLTVASTDGCPVDRNLYAWTPGGAPTLINSSPGATLAAPSGAISGDGSRVYFAAVGNLYLRDGAQTKQADAAAGGGGTFQVASTDGQFAFFTKAGHLYRYSAGADSAIDLTPAGGVVGVLGASAAGGVIYYQDGAALKRWAGGSTATVAGGSAAADPSDYPPATGTSRVSADGTKLLFVSTEALSGYDNTDLISGDADSQVFLYDATGPGLTCVSCNPTNGRPIGPSSIPGAMVNGAGPTAPLSNKPRVLSADGRRVFFDSADALALTDTNSAPVTHAGVPDVYQWEAAGSGTCAKPGGCVALISSGRSPGGARFVDASADGSDAFFLTDDSLVAADPGALDLYDARVGGGYPVPVAPIPCEGDACQVLPAKPIDPTLTTLLSGRGNPAPHYIRQKHGKRAKKRCKQRDEAKRRACQKRVRAR